MQRKSKRTADRRKPSAVQPASEGVDTDEIDISWESEPSAAETHEQREAMPTLLDEDPLLDPARLKKPRVPRDMMPTLPDIDPLSYDLDEEPGGGGSRGRK